MNKQNNSEKPILKILQELKDGRIDAQDLSRDMLIDCTEILTIEGYSKASIGQILDKCQRSINRYLQEIWGRNAKRPSPEAALCVIGEFILKSRAQQEHLSRLTRSQEGSLQERVQAAYYAFKIHDGTIARLQVLGFLPAAPQKLIGDVYHHDGGETRTLSQLKEELISIVKAAEDEGVLDQVMKEKIKLLNLKIDKAEIAEDIVNLEKTNQSDEKEEENE